MIKRHRRTYVHAALLAAIVTTAPGSAHAKGNAAGAPAKIVEGAEAGHHAAPDSKLILWEFSSLGVDEVTTANLQRLFLSELKRLLASSLIENPPGLDSEVRQSVDDCGGSTLCLAEAAQALDIDRVMVGSLATLGDAYSLNIKLIDAVAVREIGKARVSLSGDRNKMLAGMQQLIYELIDPSLLKGALVVELQLDGATIFVDGKEIGTTPLSKPIEGLAAGEHTLKVTSPMMEDYLSFFEIYSGKTTTVVVDARHVKNLEAELAAADIRVQVPVYKRWWFWSIAGAVLAVGGATTYVLLRSSTSESPQTSLGNHTFGGLHSFDRHRGVDTTWTPGSAR